MTRLRVARVTTRLRAVRAMTRLMVVRATTRSRVVMATIRSPVATARATLRSLNMTRRTTFESSADGQTITITDTLNSYVDTVTGVETLRFKDGDIAVSLDAGQLVLTGDDTIGDNIEIVGQYPVTVRGRGFDDDLEGSSGDDTLEGGSGDDTLEGGAGDDTLDGGGDDTITGGDGDDKITGGDGTSDVAVFEYDQTNYTFESSADGQTITITDTLNSYVDTVTGVETLKFADGEIEVSLDAGQLVLTGDDTIGDNIEIVGQYPVTVRGRDFDDDIVGGASGDDTLEGGSGDDTLEGAVRAMTRLMVASGRMMWPYSIGDKKDFTFSVANDGTLKVTDTNTATALGVDTLNGIETLRFDDGDLQVSTDSAG